MKRTAKIIGRFLKFGTLLSTAGFIGATLIQIYARFFLETAPSWTEEAARFFFVYAVSFAAGLAMKHHYYVQFDLVYRRMGPKQQRLVNLLVALFSLLLFLVLTFYAISFVIVGIPERSPSLGVPMAIAFTSMVIMGLAVSVFALFDILKLLSNQNKRE
ncbi:MAG: TRAP transporter small permease subunit [Bacteroidota bacterium]